MRPSSFIFRRTLGTPIVIAEQSTQCDPVAQPVDFSPTFVHPVGIAIVITLIYPVGIAVLYSIGVAVVYSVEAAKRSAQCDPVGIAEH